MDYRLLLSVLFLVFGFLPFFTFMLLKNKRVIKSLFIILTIFYSIVVLIGVLTNIQLGETIYIAKSVDINRTFNFSPITRNVRDITINICMLAPLGFLLGGIINKYKVIKSVTFGLILSIFIEVMQYILPIGRNAQLTDIILNTISALIGVLIFKACEFFKNRNKKDHH